MRRATRPFDPEAMKAANEAVSDLTDPPGRPLDPTSRADAELRTKWMDAYAAAGGGTEVVKGNSEAARTTQQCTAENHNYIELRYLHCDETPVKNARYHIRSSEYSKDGTLDANGFVRIDGVPDISGFSYYFDKDPETYEPQGPAIPSDAGKEAAVSTLDEVGQWIWGTAQGDFNDKQSVSQIAVNTVLGLIPIVDQILDARDLIAGCKNIIVFYLESDEEQAKHEESLGLSYEIWLWLGVFLIAIGCIPTVGSAVKGVLKGIIKGMQDAAKSAGGLNPSQWRRIWEEALKILNHFGVTQGNAHRWLKDVAAELPNLMDKAALKVRYALDAVRKMAERAEDAARALSGRLISKVGADEIIAQAQRYKKAIAKAYDRLEVAKARLNGWLSEQLNHVLGGKAPEVKSGHVNTPSSTNTLKQGEAAPPEVEIPPKQLTPEEELAAKKAAQLAEEERIRRLGTDPVSKRYRQAEADAAQRLEKKVGTLERDPDGAGDWIDKNGTTYDAVGPVPSQYFDERSFNHQVDRHLLKQGVDVTVVDTTGLNPSQKAAVLQHLDTLSPDQRARVILQGD
jgi:hypothetical protein